ncbi:MAG: glucokinase, partial [Gammaproteobacteria bacterium]|nr:glucokinase [Gammaproteobacteria bacterium]
MKVLSGDIGGTKTRLSIVDLESGYPEMAQECEFQSRDFHSFGEVLGEYLSRSDSIADVACFGVAGPVRDGLCETTNLPWIIDAEKIKAEYGWSNVTLINDLEAVAWGISMLGADDFFILNAGKPETASNAAVIAAGTGLGQAGLCWDGQRYIPFACEGGHADFAPANKTEVAFSDWLAEQYGHVSWERVASGMGLVNIYEFLLEYRDATSPEWLVGEMCSGDAAAAISGAAMAGRDVICIEALDMFVRFLGAESGNLALKMMATGGVYIAGGIAPRILERLKQADFMEAFCAKGRMSSLM